jgi:hypothetical protein
MPSTTERTSQSSSNPLDPTMALLRRLVQDGFWGNLTVIFQHGQIVRVLKEESLLANQLEPDNRGVYERISS